MIYEKKIRTVFIGTPNFAIPSLEAIRQDDFFDIVLVVTQPDKPAGRKQVLTPPPIKACALDHGLALAQPAKINYLTEEIKKINPDLIITVAYAQLIPEEILNLPKYGCLNVHGSLLPKYRGAAVVQAPILNGDKETGVTVMKMDKNLDTGPILAQKKLDIKPTATAGDIYDPLAILGAKLLIDTVKGYVDGKIIPREQDNSRASYVKILKKSDGLIDWSKPAGEIERLIRAMSPWPSAWTWWQGKQIKIWQAQAEPLELNTYKPGKTFIYNKGLAVQCGRDALVITKVQLEGKNILTSEEFIRGHGDFIGAILA